MPDISLIPYDRIINLQDDLNIIKNQIANLQTDLSTTEISINNQLTIINSKIDNIKMYNYFPDWSKAKTVSMPYTAENNGWFIAHAVNTSTTVYINNVSVAQGNWQYCSWSGNLNCQILVSKGDIITGATGTMKFIPCIG